MKGFVPQLFRNLVKDREDYVNVGGVVVDNTWPILMTTQVFNVVAGDWVLFQCNTHGQKLVAPSNAKYRLNVVGVSTAVVEWLGVSIVARAPYWGFDEHIINQEHNIIQHILMEVTTGGTLSLHFRAFCFAGTLDFGANEIIVQTLILR